MYSKSMIQNGHMMVGGTICYVSKYLVMARFVLILLQAQFFHTTESPPHPGYRCRLQSWGQ